MKYIRANIVLFFVIYIATITFVYFISYNMVINSFLDLENKQNQTNINTLLSNINSQLTRIQGNANDYAKWDDTYAFLNKRNPKYVYENFREGTTAIEDLDLNFMLFVSLNQKTFFSKYNSSILSQDQSNFEHDIIETFKNNMNITSVYVYKQNYLYISKVEVNTSDETETPNGFVLMGKLINHQELNALTKVFKSISFHTMNPKSLEQSDSLDFEFKYIPKAKVIVSLINTTLKNEVHFFNNNQEYITSIIAENEREIVNNGLITILIFNVIIDLFILIILILLYNNQRTLEKHNDFLEAKVKRRTNQLARSLQKLQNKNTELYAVANKDYLTKINNRRNYFVESERLLQEAIEHDFELSVLIIDIDHFKQINDTYGHAIGDKILITFCDIINEIIDEDTIFGRIGGEEFCITFSNKSLEDVSIIAEAIRSKCENTTLHINEHKINFTISLGLSNKKDHQHIDEILQQADELLYNAKKSGRNKLIRTTVHNKSHTTE